MNNGTNASQVRAGLRRIAAAVAAAAFVFLVPATINGQRNNGWQNAPRNSAPQNRPAQPRAQQPRLQQRQPQQPQSRQYENRPNSFGAPQNRQYQNQQRQYESRQLPVRPAYPGARPEYAQPYAQSPNTVRPVTGFEGQRGNAQPQTAPRPGGGLPAQGFLPSNPNSQTVRPALPGLRQPSTNSGTAPPGHLGSWLNQHGNLPVQGQQQLLRNDPSFKNLPQSDQQRLMQQLQQVNQLPEQERQRRLARAETIERMSPQDRMQLNQSTRQLSTLPADRQTIVKRAFRDLRGVPLDQRQTVLNSQRYQGQFTSEERGILGNLLRAEPYQPQQ